MIADPQVFVVTFPAAARIGAVPVPMYPPPSLGDTEHYLEGAAAIIDASQAGFLAHSASLIDVLQPVAARARPIQVESLVGSTTALLPDPSEISTGDLALLQFTSGSTSAPRGLRTAWPRRRSR